MKRFLGAILILIFSVLTKAARAEEVQTEMQNQKTLSPYFFVSGDESGADVLPLKSTSAQVTIAGMIADVTIRQVYGNQGKKALEAIYLFPASTHAAVYAMEMRVGERVIVAKVKEKAEAAAEYHQAKAMGKNASLLEEKRPNVFQMKVANIMPGDTITVELRYTETLVPEHGMYEFVYPTVVGPRYSNRPAATTDSSEHWVANPYLHQGTAPTYHFMLTADITTGIALKELSSPSHQIDIRYEDASHAHVSLKPEETSGGNRDFVLRYRLEGEAIESGLILQQGTDENFFLLMAEPPKRVLEEHILPRDYSFIIDVSGSMYGFPLDTAKAVLRGLLSKLRPTDRFNVLLFSGGSEVLSPQALEATPENLGLAIKLIEGQRGGGGTELLPALRRAFSMPTFDGYARTFVVVTDGYVDVEPEAFDLVRQSLNEANLFAFGIGSGVNRHLIEGLAHMGRGEPVVVQSPAEAVGAAERFEEYLRTPLLTDITVQASGVQIYDLDPLSVPDLFAQRPLVVYGKWKGKTPGQIIVHATSAQGEYEAKFPLDSAHTSTSLSALRYLWARSRIATLNDYTNLRWDAERVKEVTSLGLAYNLLTPYTSFIAVDEAVRNPSAESKTVKQPLPLPQGVTDMAVGNSTGIPSVPEPDTEALMLVGLFVLFFFYRVTMKRNA